MAETTFDTLATSENLQQCGLSEEQSKGIARAINGAIIGNVATKSDIESVRGEIKTLQQSTKSEIESVRAEIKTFQQSTKSEIESVRGEIKTFQQSTKSDFESVRGEIKNLQQTTSIDIKNLRQTTSSDLAALESRLKLWMFKVVSTGAAAIVAVTKLLDYVLNTIPT